MSNSGRCEDRDDEMTCDGVSPGEEDAAIRWRRGCRHRWVAGKGRCRMEEAVTVAHVEESAAAGGLEVGATV